MTLSVRADSVFRVLMYVHNNILSIHTQVYAVLVFDVEL